MKIESHGGTFTRKVGEKWREYFALGTYIHPRNVDFKSDRYAGLENKLLFDVEASSAEPREGYHFHNGNGSYRMPSFALATVSDFPKLRYEFVETDRIYDDWGRVNENLHLKNVAFEVPKSIAANKGNIRLMNAINKVEVPLEVNANEYMECVRKKIVAAAGSAPAAVPAPAPMPGR